MAEVIIMPKLGFNMDSGQLVTWLKKPGEAVRKGEPLFEINTDKTTMPVEATVDGVLLKVMLQEGESADVFTPIAVIGGAGEDADAALAAHAGGAGAAAPSPAAPAAPGTPAGGAAPAAVRTGDLKLTPKARKLVADEGIDPSSLASVQGTGYQGGITAKDIKASPLARKIAVRDNINLAAVAGTGAGGKIMAADVQRSAAMPAQPGVAGKTDQFGRSIARTVPYAGVRKIIGDRLAQSKFTAPHLYFTDCVDMSKFTIFREELAGKSGRKFAVSDLLTLAAAKALQKHPDLNVSLQDGQIIHYESINIGNAVAGEQGLIVPVIRDVQRKTLTAISSESRALVERAKAGRLTPEEFSGGTFTISNLGMFGIENFTAIINPPEAAILSVSSTRKKVVVVTDADGEDRMVIRPMMNVQLTVDHRLIDGLLAAQWMKTFKELLENPLTILL